MRIELTHFCGKADKHSSTHWNFWWTEIQVISLPTARVNPAFLAIKMKARRSVKNDGEATRLYLTLRSNRDFIVNSFLLISDRCTSEGPDQ